MTPLIIAHRGASAFAPENTLAAFRLAWEQGADAIETDLRRAGDGTLVAFHDADGRRLLGDHRPLRDIPRSELPAPTLAEVLATVPSSGQVVLELKEPLVDILVPNLPPAWHSRVTLIAFDADTISAAKRALPDCRALWLFGEYRRAPRDAGAWLAAEVRRLGVDGVDLRHARALNDRLLAPLREAGRTVFTYTVNRAAAARRCAALGLDGITTDRPADVRRWLR